MLSFEQKMLNNIIVGTVFAIVAFVVWVLLCHKAVLGPRAPLILSVLGVTFVLQFSVISLYFPERALHKKFISFFPKWIQERVDGLDEAEFVKKMNSKELKQ